MVDNNKINKFELPRPDWHDNVETDAVTGEIIGRIYKDALIENFNAIEDKCSEIQELDVFDIPIPEPTGVVYPDVTLDSNLSQIVNLKSLIDICNLRGYPISISFSGNTCTKLRYYQGTNTSLGQEPAIIEKTNIKTDASSSKPYIYLDMDNQTLVTSNSPYGVSGSGDTCFIGMYVNGRVIHQRSQLYPNTSTIKGS